MPISTLDIVVIISYLGLMLGIGFYFSKRNKNAESFSISNKKIPSWALGLSFYATFLSAITFLGDPGKAFGSNWNPFVFSLSMPIAAIIASKLFVPFYRNSSEISAYTHLEKRFGVWARTYSMACFVLTQLARMGTIFYGIALTFNALTGFDMRLIIISVGLIIIIYTVVGGMEAVIWTEVIQAIIKTLGAILILYLLVSNLGFDTIIEIGKRDEKFSLGTFRFDFQESSFWVVLFYGICINLTNFGVDQNYIQRYHSAENTNDASKSIWQCVGYYLIISSVFFFIGTALYVFYLQHPDLIENLKQTVANEKNIELNALKPSDYGDRILPFFMKTQIPTGLLGLLLAAILSAAMSTMSSGMNSSATVFLNDIYLRFINKDLDSAQKLKVLRVSTICIGLLGITFGIAMIGVKSLLDVWWKLSGIFAGGMLGIFLLGFWIKNITNFQAKIATFAGLIVIGLLTFKDFFHIPIESKMTVVLGTGVMLLVGGLLVFLKLGERDNAPSE